MTAIMYSIKPQHTIRILNKEKVLEIRKTCPKEWKDYLSGKTKVKPEPMKCLIYCTKNKPYLMDVRKYEHLPYKYDLIDYGGAKWDENAINGKVVAEFTLRDVDSLIFHQEGRFDTWNFKDGYALDKCLKESCLTMEEIVNYIGDSKDAYALHIDDLIIYDTPKGIREFFHAFSKRKDNVTFAIRGQCLERQKRGVCDYSTRLKRPPQSWCYVECVN